MRVPWELNPQPFALLTQCSTTEPQEHYNHLFCCPDTQICAYNTMIKNLYLLLYSNSNLILSDGDIGIMNL